MLPGPVFNVELLTTSRRARYFVVRVVYALILLFILWQSYQSYFWWSSRTSGQFSIQEMSQFSRSTFYELVVAQIVAVLVLTPVMTAGVITDEKQRKTLHYLLASRLSSGEIVLGKLMARLLHIGIFLTLALPILSLMTLFGGVDPIDVLYIYATTFTTAFLLAGLSLWISTVATKVRDAIMVAYLLELTWLCLPPALDAVVQYNLPSFYNYFGPVNAWVLGTHPLYVFATASGPRVSGGGMDLLGSTLWMMGLQVGFGLVFVALAVWRLRPIHRSQGGEAKPRSWRARLSRPLRLMPRPGCGDDPMLWKEMHIARSAGFVRWIVRVLTAIGLAFLIYWLVDLGAPAFAEAWRHGYTTTGYADRESFNVYLRSTGTVVYLLWTIGVAASAASSVTSEREEDTWTSLTATDLGGGEIIQAKIIGAVWSVRWLGGLLLILGAVGVASGAVHPFGFLATAVEVGVFTWFAAALGTALSLRSKNTTRATALTVLILAILNGVYMMCCIPFRPDTPLIAVGCQPFILVLSLMSYRDVWWLFGYDTGIWYGGPSSDSRNELVLACFLGLAAYGAGAILLTTAAVAGFDRAVDRPRWMPLTLGRPDRPKSKPEGGGVED